LPADLTAVFAGVPDRRPDALPRFFLLVRFGHTFNRFFSGGNRPSFFSWLCTPFCRWLPRTGRVFDLSKGRAVFSSADIAWKFLLLLLVLCAVLFFVLFVFSSFLEVLNVPNLFWALVPFLLSFFFFRAGVPVDSLRRVFSETSFRGREACRGVYLRLKLMGSGPSLILLLFRCFCFPLFPRFTHRFGSNGEKIKGTPPDKLLQGTHSRSF